MERDPTYLAIASLQAFTSPPALGGLVAAVVLPEQMQFGARELRGK